MSTIIIGAAVTAGVFILIVLLFRRRADQGNASHPGIPFSSYDGGYDGLGERGGAWDGRESGQDAANGGGSHDGGWGDSGSGGDGGGDGGGGDGGGGE